MTQHMFNKYLLSKWTEKEQCSRDHSLFLNSNILTEYNQISTVYINLFRICFKVRSI